LRRQIYSLIPLATWVPHPIVSRAALRERRATWQS
jgi:hypothetical protein